MVYQRCICGVSKRTQDHRDELFFDFDSQVLRERMRIFFSKSYGEDFKERYHVFPSSSFDIEVRRDQTAFDGQYVKRCLYRPFDIRYLYYDPKLTSRPAYKVMRHMLQENRALVATRQTSDPFAVLATSTISGHKSMAGYDINSIFPLYLYPAGGELEFEKGRQPNLNPTFIKAIAEKLGLKFVEDGKGDLEETFGPEDIFNYTYAVFHSHTYRSCYAEFLKIDFPRLRLTSDKQLFRALVENFEGIRPEVWNFHIGGYQVCQKWLKDRKGRTLTYDELAHYQKAVVALKETIRLMGEIDALIGNWPLG